MTRVCHLTSAHANNDTRIFYKECTSLANAGYETYLIAPGDSYERNGVKIIGVGKSKSRIVRMLRTTSEVYKKAVEVNADIYHIHDPELLIYALKLKKRGKIVIFDSHENYTEAISQKKWIPFIFRNLVELIFKKYFFYIIKKIDAIISVTPNIIDILNKFNNKTVMITNYPIIKKDHYAGDVNLVKKSICFAGGITKQWSHDNILQALKICIATEYTLCGTVSESYINQLRLISSWEKVNYLGKVSLDEVSKILRASSVGMAILQKSNNTGGNKGTLGNTKLFEYMLAGIPFVCTNFILWEKIVKEYECGICVDPENIEEIAQAINHLLDNPIIAKQMGENGRKAVLEKYNWGVEEKKLLKLYEELLSL